MAPGTSKGSHGILAAPGAGQRHPDCQRLQHWHDGERLSIPGGIATKHLLERSLAFKKIVPGQIQARFRWPPNDCPGATHRKQVGGVEAVNAVLAEESGSD